MQQSEPEGADAFVPGGEQPFELHEHAARGEQHALGVRHRARQLERGGEARRRREESARLGRRAERLVELLQHARAATLREPVARQREQLAERRDADAAQERGVEARHLHRQRLERRARAAREP